MARQIRRLLSVFAVGLAASAAALAAAPSRPVTVPELRLFLLNHQIPVYRGIRHSSTYHGKAYAYTYLDLSSHPGKGIEVSDTPASKRYNDPSMTVFVPLPVRLHCVPRTEEESRTIADGRFCWTHYKAGFANSDPKLNPAHWALTLYYRNIAVNWDFAGHDDRSVPAGVFAFDALMRQLVAAR
jgi:hypothetical protein